MVFSKTKQGSRVSVGFLGRVEWDDHCWLFCGSEKLVGAWPAAPSHLPVQHQFCRPSDSMSRIELYRASFQSIGKPVWETPAALACVLPLLGIYKTLCPWGCRVGTSQEHLERMPLPPLHHQQPKALTVGNGIWGAKGAVRTGLRKYFPWARQYDREVVFQNER